MEARRRVLLAYMPFGLIQIAPLGLSLLKPALARRGIPCDIRYFNLDFVEACLAGPGRERGRLYSRLTSRYELTFAAEARVAELLFGRDPARAAVVDGHVAQAQPDERALIEALPDRFARFLADCVDGTDWSQYAVLGLSTVFLGMTVPSLLLAREVKRRFPHIVTVLGGPNTEGPMGEVLARRFPFVDYVLRGEADESWPLLVGAVLDGAQPGAIPGLVQRRHDGTLQAWPSRPIERMDALPFPDFDDFIAATRRSVLAERYRGLLQLPFESSRGCWWGQMSHCKFCGINAQGMGFRSKSTGRLIEEVEWLSDRYEPDMLLAADAILDRAYFGTTLPALAARRPEVQFSYEIKANVTRDQIRQMHDARITEILPGIETFSTRLLKLMKKGSSAFDNLLCLRLAEEYGIKVSWYHMYGLPRETREDYDEDLETIRRIPHLQPPRELARFTLQRFTPYLRDAAAEGLTGVRPMAEYRAVFPFADADLADLAYHFEFDFADSRATADAASIEARLKAAVIDWRSRYGRVALDVIDADGEAVIIDTRGELRLVYALDALSARLYAGLDRPHTAATLAAAVPSVDPLEPPLPPLDSASPALEAACRAAARFGATVASLTGPAIDGGAATGTAWEHAVRTWLDKTVDCGLVYAEGGRFLALAVRRSHASLAARQDAAVAVALS